ncbi:hypothetical protein RYX45_20240, partial [Alkalihalophilus pseudofirmus]
ITTVRFLCSDTTSVTTPDPVPRWSPEAGAVTLLSTLDLYKIFIFFNNNSTKAAFKISVSGNGS